MKKQVLINIKMTQTVYNEKNTMEFSTEARFYKKGKIFYIVYEETDVTGMEGTTTTIKVSDNAVAVIRLGSISSNLIFEKGRRHSFNYNTGYGFLKMAVKVNDMNVSIDENGGELYIDYEIEIEGNKLGDNFFHLVIM